MVIYSDIKDCPMLRFCMAADGDVSALLKSGKIEKESDAIKVAEVFEKLTSDYHKQRKSIKYGTIVKLIEEIERKRLQLMIYDNCFIYLSYKWDDNMAAILERSILNITLPKFGSKNYIQLLQEEYRKLGRLRLLIEKKQEQLNIISKKEMSENETAVSSFYKMLQAISMWQMYRENAKTITVYEYAIVEGMYLKHLQEQKKNDIKKA